MKTIKKLKLHNTKKLGQREVKFSALMGTLRHEIPPGKQ